MLQNGCLVRDSKGNQDLPIINLQLMLLGIKVGKQALEALLNYPLQCIDAFRYKSRETSS